jgi:hypothetical protein
VELFQTTAPVRRAPKASLNLPRLQTNTVTKTCHALLIQVEMFQRARQRVFDKGQVQFRRLPALS